MMSSAETLNFGPQWLRDLSEGSSNSSSQPTSQPASMAKFKLAENRYGREEMLALFVDDSEVPEELHRAPSLVSEIIQPPLAFRPSDHSQGQLTTSYRGRGMPSGLRGRSIPNRGRGRGRGTAWADHDDGPLRRPPLVRRSESEDWRSDSLRGKGDGAEDIIGKEWRIAGHGQRQDFWKDAWRDRPEEPKEQRNLRGRSLSSRDAEDSDRRWREDDFDMFPTKSKTSEPQDGSPNHGKQPGKRKDNDVQDEEEVFPKHNGEEQQQTSSKSPSGDAKPPDSDQSSGGQRRTSLLDPVLEVKEGAEIGQNITNSNRESNQNSKNALEEMFQRLAANDSDGGSVNVPLPQSQHTLQKSDPITSTVQVENHSSASSIGAFSSNSPFGDIPVTSNSPIAQLQALATTWFYKDPQGDIQGPFSSTQMMEWFNAGYFTMDLLVKRACDTDFTPLGELIKTCGQIPFSSQPKNPFPNTQSQIPSSGISSVLQQYAHAQQREVLFNMKLLDGPQQPQPSTQVPTQVIQQPALGRTFQNQPDLQVIWSNLMKNPDFLRMSPQQRQQVVRQYVEELKRQAIAADATRGGPFQHTPTSDGLGVIGGNINGQVQPQADVLMQQKLLEEARRKEEEEIRRIKRQQEEQKELLRKQEEEFRRKKEMLLREEEEIKQLQLEAQRKREELQRNLEEEKMKKIQEMQELERKRKQQEEEERRRQKEEQERREAEQRRIQEEEEKRRREEERIRQEMEETIRLEQLRQEEIKRLEIEREERRMIEEIRKREEMEKQAAREAELQRKAEAARIQQEKAEAETKALLKKQQQEKQMQQIQLPSHARWGHNQPSRSYNESLSLVEIQKLEKEEELTRIKEEARMVRENRTQAPKPKTGWGAPSQEAYGVSLLDIQREEAKQMSVTKQATKPEKIPSNLSATSWSKPPKIQPDVQKPKPTQPQASFWDQVVEENPKKPTPQTQKQTKQQPKQAKQQKGAKQKVKNDEGQHIKALFQQQISKDSFTDWCETYLAKINVGSIDIPTFVNFLRDVESSYEVQEYVQSYLGESREAKEFSTLFLEQRAKLTGNQYQSSQNRSSGNVKTAAARDTDGFEVVTSNTKRGKKKLRKLQKVDPSILGFSVNAASDRVNMGEIQNADN